jgi:enoyl-CoA hydratase
MSDLVLAERDGAVATLTLNDPEHRNAMSRQMGEVFAGRVGELAGEADLRAVILTGAGRAFCAGGDMDMIAAQADAGAAGHALPGHALRSIRDSMRSFYTLFLSVRDLPCPTIAAINGHAIGAGLCVALACDLRVASANAKLGLNFTRLGLHPGMAATWTLPRLVGPAVAAELLYTGRLVDGNEAARLGVVNRAVASEEVVPTARELAAEIASASPLAVRGVKRALARSLDASLDDQLSFEATEQAGTFESRDVGEGLAAARERRAPKFAGR